MEKKKKRVKGHWLLPKYTQIQRINLKSKKNEYFQNQIKMKAIIPNCPLELSDF
jgi:hypothetical protein